MFWLYPAAVLFLAVAGAELRERQSFYPCPLPTITGVKTGGTYALSSFKISGTVSTACPGLGIQITSTLAGGFSKGYGVSTQPGGSFTWTAASQGYIYPGPYTITIYAQPQTGYFGTSLTYTSVTLNALCPSTPQFSAYVGDVNYGWPGLVFNGTGASAVAPCNAVTLIAEHMYHDGKGVSAGSATADSTGAWSATLFPNGNPSVARGFYDVFPAVAYGTAWSNMGGSVFLQSPDQCNTPTIVSINTTTPYVSVTIGNVSPNCEIFTAVFTSDSNSYTTSLTQVTGPNTQTLTLVSASLLPNGQYTVQVQATDTNLPPSAYASQTFTLAVGACPPPTFSIANNTVFTTYPMTLTGTYSPNCPTLTFISQDGIGAAPMENNNQNAVITQSGGKFTWQPYLLGDYQQYVVSITSCNSYGASYCATTALQFYLFYTSCDTPKLVNPVGSQNTPTPLINGTIGSISDTKFCDQAQLFWKDPAGQQFSLPVAPISWTPFNAYGGQFSYPWNGAVLPNPGTYSFWVQVSSSVGKGASGFSARVSATFNIPTVPACTYPTFATVPSAIIIPQNPTLQLSGTFDPRCNQLQWLVNGVAQPMLLEQSSGTWLTQFPTGQYADGQTVTYALASSQSGGSLLPTTSNVTTITYWSYACSQPTITTPTADQLFGHGQVVKGTFSTGANGDCTTVNTYFDTARSPYGGTTSITGGTAYTFKPTDLLSTGSHQVYVENVGKTGRPGYTLNNAPAWIPFTVALLPTVQIPQAGATYYPNVVFNGSLPPDWQQLAVLNLYFVPAPTDGSGPWTEELVATSGGYGVANGIWSISPNTGSHAFGPGSYTGKFSFYQSGQSAIGYQPSISFNIAAMPVTSPTSRKRKLCTAGFDSCPLVRTKRKGGQDIECVPDLKSNLERCGACDGPDCTAISNVDRVECVAGSCVVQSCMEGFDFIDNGCNRTLNWGDSPTPTWTQ